MVKLCHVLTIAAIDKGSPPVDTTTGMSQSVLGVVRLVAFGESFVPSLCIPASGPLMNNGPSKVLPPCLRASSLESVPISCGLK